MLRVSHDLCGVAGLRGDATGLQIFTFRAQLSDIAEKQLRAKNVGAILFEHKPALVRLWHVHIRRSSRDVGR